MTKRFNILSLTGKLMFFVILWGCNTETIYEKNHDFSNKFWHVDSVPAFNFRINDADIPYDINYHVRNTDAYPFYNIYFKYYLQDSATNRELASAMENLILFEPKTGKPKGGGLGDIFNHDYTILENYNFDTTGTYQIKLEHFMRRDTLPEIISVGISVQKAHEENQ